MFAHPVSTLVFFVGFSILSNGLPVVERKTLPTDWRKMIGNDAYEYSMKKANENRTMSDKFEGDIAGIDVEAMLGTNLTAALAQNAVLDKDKLWSGGVVPYVITDDQYTQEEHDLMVAALNDMSSKTCVKFVPRTDEPNYITFVSQDNGCNSYIGRTRGQQLIHLQRGCITYFGEVQHEVMHALGFNHEQTRLDRDDYIDIILDNVDPNNQHNFEKYSGNTFNLPYDYNSIMHYGFNDFAIDKQSPTIVPKTQGANIGNRKVMSDTDVEKINLLYECNGSGTGSGGPSPDAVTPDPGTDGPDVETTRRRHRQRHRSPFLDFDSFFSNFGDGFGGNFGSVDFFLGNEDKHGGKASNISSVNPRKCPIDSPHKTRNDFCQNDQDCKDSGLGNVCCPNCVGKSCTSFCS